VWTYLEREIRKVAHSDSELMIKIQENTKILTDCLADTKVSNVVKENTTLLNDHNKVKRKIGKINENLAKEIMNYEVDTGFKNATPQQRKMR
jgi:hypothetical protein